MSLGLGPKILGPSNRIVVKDEAQHYKKKKELLLLGVNLASGSDKTLHHIKNL